MDSGRLKTAAILILLMVNLAFGWLILNQRRDESNLQAQTRKELVQVMENMGITLEEGSIPRETVLRKYTLTRDMALETALVQAFLGSAPGQDMGGNIHYYENDNGRASFRSSGDFELLVSLPGSSIERRLAENGLLLAREEDEYVCLLEEQQVFNCRIRLSALEGDSYRIYGRCMLGTLQPGKTVSFLGAATLLLRFRDQAEESGKVFTQIRSIRSGYLLRPAVPAAELLPVWCIETDGGAWYVNVEDGQLLGDSGTVG